MLFIDFTYFTLVYKLLISTILKTMLAQGKSLSYIILIIRVIFTLAYVKNLINQTIRMKITLVNGLPCNYFWLH